MIAGTHRSGFKKGDQIGMLEVVHVFGWSKTNPTTGKTSGSNQWWYRVQCSNCGRLETRMQKTLKCSKMCTVCARKRRGMSKATIYVDWWHPESDEVPRFSRIFLGSHHINSRRIPYATHR